MKKFEEVKKELEKFLESISNKGTLNKTSDEIKIILGQEPYKRYWGDKYLAVESKKAPYDKLNNNIAFLVTEWIKIQCSLEMVFNLLFDGNVNSLKVLSYLRENDVDAEKFGQYLYEEYGIVLTNAKGNEENLKNFIKEQQELNKTIYLLCAGKVAEDLYKNIEDDIKIVPPIKFIHPSENNLKNDTHYTDWHDLKKDNFKDKNTIDKFKIILRFN